MRAGSGIVAGVMIWGLATALGLGAVLAVSPLAYRVIQLAGAVYLLWLGVRLMSGAFARRPESVPSSVPDEQAPRWFVRGLLTNLLNPKVGVFYVSLLPQFIPEHVPPVAFGALLAGIHAVMDGPALVCCTGACHAPLVTLAAFACADSFAGRHDGSGPHGFRFACPGERSGRVMGA